MGSNWSSNKQMHNNTRNKDTHLSLSTASARARAKFIKNHIVDGHFSRAEISAAVKSKWATMEDERARGHPFATWGIRVNDFTSPCTFLIFNIGPASVEMWIGAAAVSGAEAREMALQGTAGPVKQMVKTIRMAPQGWCLGLKIRRSEFRLSSPPKAKNGKRRSSDRHK